MSKQGGLRVTAVAIQVLQSLVVVAFAPLYAGVITRAEAVASFMISLAGLDTASPSGGLGASRASWIGSMAEPALILVFFTVGAVSTTQPAGPAQCITSRRSRPCSSGTCTGR